MRYATFVYGTPEYTRATAYEIELCNYYRIPKVAKSLSTTSKEPDSHAASEISVHTLFAALAGARAFRCAGLVKSKFIGGTNKELIILEIKKNKLYDVIDIHN